MAATLTFAADYSNFEQALERATLKLRSFGLEPSKVEKALGRIGDSFSGQRLISEATLSARAIADLGGAGGVAGGLLKLTTTELQRAGTQARAAADKMKALGIEVPPNIERLAKAIEPIPRQLTLAERAAGLAKSTFGQMFGAFSAASLVDRAVGTLINFGKEAFTSAGRIVDLSAKLNISTDAIQRWEFVAKQTGSTLEDFSGNAFKLGTRLAGGAGSVQQAVKDLGLSFQQLRTLKPEDQFDTVVSALSKMEDATKRNALGVAIFGKGFESIASAVAQGYADIAKGATLSTEAQLKALDTAGDEWEKLTDRIGKATQGALASILHFGNEALKGILFEGNKKPTGDIAGLMDPRLAQPSMVPPLPENYVAQLKAAKDALAALTPETRKQITAAIELGVKTEDVAEQFGISVEVLGLYRSSLTATTKIAQDATKESTDLAKATAAFLSEANNAEGIRRMNQDLDVLRATSSAATRELQKLGISATTGAVQTQIWNQSLGLLDDLIGAVPAALKSQNVSEEFHHAAGGIQTDLTQLNEGFRLLAQVSGDSWGGVTRDIARVTAAIQLAQQSAAAYKSGDRIAGTIGGIAAVESATGSGSRASRVFGGAATGAQVGGQFMPGIGAAIGAGVGAIIGVFRGPGEGEETNDLRDAAVDAAGGFDVLSERAARAGVSLDRMFGTQKLKAFQSAWDDVSKAIAKQEGILQKYNITWKDFSGAARMKELGKAVSDVVGDFTALTTAGLSHETAALKVRDAYVSLATEAVQAGEEIPAAMAPVLKQLAEMGRLTNAEAESLLGMAGDGLPSFAAMEEAAARYGIKLGDLGDRFASMKVFESFEQIKKDFDLLTQGGAGAGTVLEGMTDELSKLLQQATAIGATIPESMRPILETLVEQGKLIDDSGHAFKDLSGVKFAEPLESAVGRLITKLDELIEKIGQTGGALAALPTDLADPTAGWGGRKADYYTTPESLPTFATGTRGRYLDFGSGTPVLLHGRERVMTEAERGTGGGAALESVAAALDGIDRRISTAVSRAVTDALILAPGWR